MTIAIVRQDPHQQRRRAHEPRPDRRATYTSAPMIEPTTRLVTSNVFSLADAPVPLPSRRGPHRRAMARGLNTALRRPHRHAIGDRCRRAHKACVKVKDCPKSTSSLAESRDNPTAPPPSRSSRAIAGIDFQNRLRMVSRKDFERTKI